MRLKYETMTMLIAFWFSRKPGRTFDCLGGCILKKPKQRAASPRLEADGRYQQCEVSGALEGLAIALVEQTLTRLEHESNGAAALWFVQQLANLPQEN